MSGFFFGTSNTGTSSTTAGYWGPGQVRIIIAPQAPPKCPDQRWIEATTGVVHQVALDPRECSRVRKALELLEASPERRWDPDLARRTYRAMARRLHPDAGGDAEAFKALSAAWDVLRRRGFCG